MLGFLEQTLFHIGQTPVQGTHLIATVVVIVVLGWTYLKGVPFIKKEDDTIKHKTLNELREPEFRKILAKYGKNLSRTIKHDKRVIGIVDREVSYQVKAIQEKENKDQDEKNKRYKTDNLPDHLSGGESDDNTRVYAFFVRDDKFIYNIIKKWVGLPERVYDVMIIPERYILDADNIVINKNANLVRYAGIDTVWSPEVKSLFSAFNTKDISELVDENLVNFTRNMTQFDKDQAKETHLKEVETEMSRRRWGDKDQRDSKKV